MTAPRPYVPPSEPAPDASAARLQINKKPWMLPRPGETPDEFDHRVAHSCAFCGEYHADLAELDQHEDYCPHNGTPRRADRRRGAQS